MDNRKLGKLGENFAAEVLRSYGYRIVKQNYRSKLGEIDIIASRGNDIDFVEVKTRRSLDHGRPGESVSGAKQQRIKNAAGQYLQMMESCGFIPGAVHFRVMEVMLEDIPDAY